MYYIKKLFSNQGIADSEVVAEFNTYMEAIQYMNNMDGERLSTDDCILDGFLYCISTHKE